MTAIQCYICGHGTEHDESIIFLGDGEPPHHAWCRSMRDLTDHAARSDAREAEYLALRFGLAPDDAKRYARECETYRRAHVLPEDLA